jgi:hypothetical protein
VVGKQISKYKKSRVAYSVFSATGTVLYGAVRCRTELGPSVNPCVVRCLYGVRSVRDVRCAPPLEPHTGARPSVRLCVGPELARCVHK